MEEEKSNTPQPGRECLKCHVHKPWDDFYTCKLRKSGKTSQCKECIRQVQLTMRRLRSPLRRCITCKEERSVQQYQYDTGKTNRRCVQCYKSAAESEIARNNIILSRAKALELLTPLEKLEDQTPEEIPTAVLVKLQDLEIKEN